MRVELTEEEKRAKRQAAMVQPRSSARAKLSAKEMPPESVGSSPYASYPISTQSPATPKSMQQFDRQQAVEYVPAKRKSGRSAEDEYRERSARKLVNLVKSAFREPVFLIALVLLLFILLFMRPFLVPSASMHPTLQEGDRIMSLARYFPNGSSYARGDIACFIAPSGDVYVKRIIGIGGDHIQITGDTVLVNGEKTQWQGTAGLVTSLDVWLADDEYWMMGDNRGNSQDSRFIGPIKADKMVSKVVAIYFPLDRITIF